MAVVVPNMYLMHCFTELHPYHKHETTTTLWRSLENVFGRPCGFFKFPLKKNKVLGSILNFFKKNIQNHFPGTKQNCLVHNIKRSRNYVCIFSPQIWDRLFKTCLCISFQCVYQMFRETTRLDASSAGIHSSSKKSPRIISKPKF